MRAIINAVLLVGVSGVAMACGTESNARGTEGGPYVSAASPEEAGRYATILGGCNDCHTPGWFESEGQTPEGERFVGSSIGWYGPWGTTYPPNLRLSVQNMSEEGWVEMLRTRRERPPMPWANTHQLNERDMRAIYRYLRSLGSAGELAPVYLPPGEAPEPPYFQLVVGDEGN